MVCFCLWCTGGMGRLQYVAQSDMVFNTILGKTERATLACLHINVYI